MFLSAIFHAGEKADLLVSMVEEGDFYSVFTAHLFTLIRDELAAGRSIAPPALMRHLHTDLPEWPVDDQRAYLASIAAGSSAVLVGASGAAQTIVDLAKRRRLYDEMQGLLVTMASDTQSRIESLVDGIDTAMSGALQRATTTRSMTFAQAFDRTLQGIDDEAAGKTPQGVRIDGLDDFNKLTGELRAGELMILGGRPSMGKTALAFEVAVGAARGGHGTLFVSLEMKIEELTARSIASLIYERGNSPSLEAVRRGKFGEFDRQRIAEARQQLDQWPLIITDPPRLHIGALAMMIRRYQRQMAAKGQRLDLVMIDYLGLIRGPKGVKRYEEVSEISRALKAIAKECGVAMIVLAQLNRETEKREDKHPQLSDLRDAGDIEQDADVVMFVFREQYYLERSEPDVTDKKRAEWETAMGQARDRMEIIAAKVRNGRIGKRVLWYFGAHQAVRNSSYFKDLHA